MKRKFILGLSTILTGALITGSINLGVFSNKVYAADPSGSIKIYCQAIDNKPQFAVQNIIDKYKKLYPSVKVNILPINIGQRFGDGGVGIDGGLVDKYNKKLLTDTLSGNGPDVLIMSPTEVNAMKLQKSSMLADLKPFLDKDPSKKNYNSKVLEAGVYNGKMTLMPLNYYVRTYGTTEQILKKYNIKINDNMTMDQFFNAANSYIKSIGSSKTKTYFAHPFSISEFLACSGKDFIDYANCKVSFDKPEFKKIIDNFKKIYKYAPKVNPGGGDGEEGIEGIKNGTTAFSDDIYLDPISLLSCESNVKGVTGQTPVIRNMPSYDGSNKPVAIVTNCMGVSKNSKNKEAAYDFIKTALDAQASDRPEYIQFLPVNNIGLQNAKKFYMTKEIGKKVNYTRKQMYVLQKPSQKITQLYDSLANGISKSVITDYDMEDMLTQGLKPYFEDKASYNSTIKALTNKLDIYLSE